MLVTIYFFNISYSNLDLEFIFKKTFRINIYLNFKFHGNRTKTKA